MSENEPSYYAVIPANVRYDSDLIPNAKLLYGEITALCNQQGFCWASNNYFATLYNVQPQAISKWVKSLEVKGYIKVEYIRKGKEIIQRNIIINDVSIKKEEVSTKTYEGINKNVLRYQQKRKENSTYINKSINNIYKEKPENQELEFSQPKPQPKPKKQDLDLSFIASEYKEMINEWIEYKKQIKNKYTQIGINKFYSKLLQDSNNNPITAQAMINRSIACNYKGVFPLNNFSNTSKPVDRKRVNVEDYYLD